MERNPVGWFEIPITDVARAKEFYESLIKVTLNQSEMVGGGKMLMFPFEDIKGASGALIKHDMYVPSDKGVVIYFTSPTGNLKKEGEMAVEKGGKVLVPTMAIGEHGHISVLLDSEGNKVALHTMQLKEEKNDI
jgi:uncharacterized protein